MSIFKSILNRIFFFFDLIILFLLEKIHCFNRDFIRFLLEFWTTFDQI